MNSLLKRILVPRKKEISGLDIFGIHFPSPIGLAEGNDVNAERCGSYMNAAFGFVEIGPLTPLPETPEKHRKLTTKGIRYVISRIQKDEFHPLISAVLLHNASSTDEEHLIEDYASAFSLLYDFVDCFCIDTDIRNMDGSRPLQDMSILSEVLDSLLQSRVCNESYKPLLLKVPADIPGQLLQEMIDYCRMAGVDGIGVLPGKKAEETIASICEYTQGRFPVIGYCPVLREGAVRDLIKSGASLVAGGTSFTSRGPRRIQALSALFSNK